MKKYITVLAVVMIVGMWSCTAFADSLARDGMVAYSGTQAFERLTSDERQACVNWLVRGGEMDALCRQAVMRLVSEAPDAVLPEQRQALIAEASGTEIVQETPPPPPPETPKVVKKDNTWAIIAAGVVGIIAGMIIHNNVGGSRRDDPPCPPHYRHYPTRRYPHVGPPPPPPMRRPPAHVKVPHCPPHRPTHHRPPHR